jgi:capsular exopolysaccharide synthesis family protein
LKRSEAQIGLRQIYQDTQLRLQTVSQQRYLVTPDARIGSLALTTGNFSGGGLPLVKIFGMIGSVLASMILAFGAAYVRDLHTRGVQTEEEIEQTSGVPNLASIPLFRSRQRFRRVNLADQIVYQPSNSYANEVRKLYFNLQLLLTKASSARSVLITSTNREEGKTTLALSLGRTAARAGTKTLIIDCDPKSSGLSHLLDLDKHAGFADVLAGCCDERHILQDDPHSSCKIMASGNASDVAAEWLLQPSRVRAVLQRLELEFDLIILDAAPVEQSADSIILRTVSDLTVFVVRTGWSRPEAIQSSIHQLQRTDDAEIVTALNFATE